MVRQIAANEVDGFAVLSSGPPDAARAARVESERMRRGADADVFADIESSIVDSTKGEWLAVCDGRVVRANDLERLLRQLDESGIDERRAVCHYVHPSVIVAPV